MKKNILNALIFLTIVGFVVIQMEQIAKPFNATRKQSLYSQQEKNSIDLAYIGSSATYVYYDVLEAYNEYNIKSMAYGYDAMPFDFVKPMIESVLDTQSPNLFVVDLRSALRDESNYQIHGYFSNETKKTVALNSLLNTPNWLAKTKIALTSPHLAGERYQHIFGILYNHNRFYDSLKAILTKSESVSSSLYQGNENLRFKSTDYSADIYDYTDYNEYDFKLTEDTINRFLDFFEFIESNDINVYFTFTPYFDTENTQDIAIRRELGNFIEENGYHFYDFVPDFEEIGFDCSTDFYDFYHVNVNGAKKYTIYALNRFLSDFNIPKVTDTQESDFWNSEYENWQIYKTERLLESD